MNRILITLLYSLFAIVSFAQINAFHGTYNLKGIKITNRTHSSLKSESYYSVFENTSDISFVLNENEGTVAIYPKGEQTSLYIMDRSNPECKVSPALKKSLFDCTWEFDHILSYGLVKLNFVDFESFDYEIFDIANNYQYKWFVEFDYVEFISKNSGKELTITGTEFLTILRCFMSKGETIWFESNSNKINTKPYQVPKTTPKRKTSPYSDYAYSYLKDSYFINTTAVYPDSRTGEDKTKKVSLAIVGDKESFAISCKELGVQAFLIQPFNYKMTKRISGGNTYYHIDFAHESSTVLNKKGDIRISLVKSSSSSNEFWINVWRMDGSDSEPYVFFPASDTFNATCIKHSMDNPTSVSYSTLFNQLLKHFYYMAYKSGNSDAFK